MLMQRSVRGANRPREQPVRAYCALLELGLGQIPDARSQDSLIRRRTRTEQDEGVGALLYTRGEVRALRHIRDCILFAWRDFLEKAMPGISPEGGLRALPARAVAKRAFSALKIAAGLCSLSSLLLSS